MASINPYPALPHELRQSKVYRTTCWQQQQGDCEGCKELKSYCLSQAGPCSAVTHVHVDELATAMTCGMTVPKSSLIVLAGNAGIILDACVY